MLRASDVTTAPTVRISRPTGALVARDTFEIGAVDAVRRRARRTRGLLVAALTAAVAATLGTGAGAPASSGVPAFAARAERIVVVIDPGHNGANAEHPEVINRLVDIGTKRKPCNTVGASTAAGLAEHAYNFAMAQLVAAELRRRGVEVVMTRTDDDGVGPCITERAAIANRAGARALVAIHADGGPPGGRGFFVIRPALVKGLTDATVVPSQRLADALVASITAGTDEPTSTYIGTRGQLASKDYGTTNLARMATVIVETANMRNVTDAANLSSDRWRASMAAAIADGIVTAVAGGAR